MYCYIVIIDTVILKSYIMYLIIFKYLKFNSYLILMSAWNIMFHADANEGKLSFFTFLLLDFSL